MPDRWPMYSAAGAVVGFVLAPAAAKLWAAFGGAVAGFGIANVIESRRAAAAAETVPAGDLALVEPLRRVANAGDLPIEVESPNDVSDFWRTPPFVPDGGAAVGWLEG